MKQPPRVVAVLATLAAAAMLLAGCAAQSASTSSGIKGTSLKGVKFAFAIPTSAGSVYVAQSDQFVKQAKKLGATVTVYDNNGDAATMLSNAQLMVAAKPDVIVEYPSAADATDRVGQTFSTAGIPCIALNVPVKGCSFFNFDQVALAEMGAEAMAAKMKAKGWTADNTSVVIGQASTLGESVNIAVTSFYAKLSTLATGMKATKSSAITPTTTSIPGTKDLQADMGLTVDSGYSSMQTALQTIPAGNNIVVYTVSDDTTIGALRAIDAAGRTNSAMVSGYGGTEPGFEKLRAGGPWVTDQVGFFPYWGEFVLAMAVAVHDGVKTPALTAPPQVVITTDNIDTYFTPGTADLIKMPALPKESEYLVKTGILQKFGNVEGLG
ncbi:sugar ABC transporter substrate-binding protein [Lysinimonas soli]|uniref:Sugar ABC transporter substrate-binding protein n=1 Tax=Lysinimonas soli TaxID=1074233 RepID=A0ABW0NSV1_9MICO